MVLGPNIPLETAIEISEGLRYTRPSTSVILVRDDSTPTCSTARCRRAVATSCVSSDEVGVTDAVARAQQLWNGPARGLDRNHTRSHHHRLLPEGRCRQDHHRRERRAGTGRPWGPQGLPRRPRPCFRRCRDHHAVLPGPHHRGSHRRGGPAGLLHGRGPAHPARRVADGARRAGRPRRPRPGVGLVDLWRAAHPEEGVRLRRGRHLPPTSTSSRSRPSTRPTSA